MAGKKGRGVGEPDARVLPAGWRVDKRGTRFYDIVDPKSHALLIRVGQYQDPIVDDPHAFARFIEFLNVFANEVEQGKWASFAFDSVSFASIGARKLHQYDLNADAKDPRQWYGGAVDALEEVLCVSLPALACNVGVAVHVSKQKIEAEGGLLRTVHVPGRLQNMVAGAYPEFYRLHVVENKAGEKVRVLQTESDDKWQAGTTIDAPDNTRVHRDDPTRTWERLWSRWPSDRQPWHGIVYAEPHAGKSTFLSCLPSPLYVALFDAVGKDAAYRRRGILKPTKEAA